MFSFFALKSVRRPFARGAKWAGLVAGAAVAACASSPVFAQAPGKIPDLGSSSGFAWTPLTINGGIGAGGASHGEEGVVKFRKGRSQTPQWHSSSQSPPDHPGRRSHELRII